MILIVVQGEERNMYDQHFLSSVLRDKYPFLHSYKYNYSYNAQYKRKKGSYFFPSSRADSAFVYSVLPNVISKDIKGNFFCIRTIDNSFYIQNILGYHSCFPEL